MVPRPGKEGANDGTRNRVVQYLYVHSPGDVLEYPTSRAGVGAGRLASRYLECALVQSASLRFNEADCELVLVTNLEDRRLLGRRGMRILELLESFGVELLHADYDHRPASEVTWFYASRYVLDAIVACASSAPVEQRLWMMDLVCVWMDPKKIFSAFPPAGAIACIEMAYDIDWDITGGTRAAFESLSPMRPPHEDRKPWIGGELLAGAPDDLLAMVAACKRIDLDLERLGHGLGTEEQLLTLSSALGHVRFVDLSDMGKRILTGPRHGGVNPESPDALGLWHLPSEKGLGFRRTASALLAGREGQVMRDLRSPSRAMRRFNVLGGKWTTRRARDDCWIVANRLREVALAHLAKGV
jgi:hypothetical protein